MNEIQATSAFGAELRTESEIEMRICDINKISAIIDQEMEWLIGYQSFSAIFRNTSKIPSKHLTDVRSSGKMPYRKQGLST